MKKISVIIPCYNVDRYIDRCINSLVTQTIGIENMQLIFVNDASTDRTARKLEWWQKRYPESIEVYHLPENRRQGGARNEGLKHACGETLGFVDSDDWIAAEMYEQLYTVLQRENCDFVNCFLKRAYDGNTELSDSVCESKLVRIDSEQAKKEFLVERLPGGNCCRLYRRELIAKAPQFPEHTAYEDNYWMAFVKLETSSYYLLGKELYYYFVNDNSTILSTNSGRHLERLSVEVAKLEEYKRIGIFEKYREEFAYEFLRLYYINSLHTFFLRMADVREMPFEEMKNTVLKYFPDYKENPYYDRFVPMEQQLLMTLEREITPEQWQMLAEQYRAVYAQ